MSDMGESLGLLTKMSDVSESLRSLTKNKRMRELLVFFGANCSFTHYFLSYFSRKNKLFAQKTDERIPNPAKGNFI